MKYYANGKPIRLIEHDDLNISNPPDALLNELSVGYDLITANKPIYNETQYLKDNYTVNNKNIIQNWEVIDFEEGEINEF